MKKSIILFAIMFFLSTSAHAFRCGQGLRNIASEGMQNYEILKDCGRPVSKETVGYEESSGSIRKIEEWVYIIENRGEKQMYLLQFNGNGILTKIISLGKVD